MTPITPSALLDPVCPPTAEDLAAALAELASRGVVRTGGNFSKDRLGGPLAESVSLLSTRALRRVLIFEPKDLTISVEAGLPWAELTELLARERMMIPLDPPFAASATVGGVVAANWVGPRRRLYGTARDNVIGMRFATVEGKIAQSGGMVVKNVAGLDMAKLFIGGWGTLGVMTSVNFKLTPQPPAERTFALSGSLESLVAARDSILRGVLQPAAVDLVNPAASVLLGLSGWNLLVRAGGSPAVLDRYARELAGFSPLDNGLWALIANFPAAHLERHPDGWVRHRTGLLTELPQLAAGEHPVIVRAATGVAYEFGRGPVPDLWPNPGSDFAAMQRVKAMLDPQHRLNPGRLYGRI